MGRLRLGLAWAAFAATVLLVLWSWRTLPAVIPIHFGASGEPNGYGGRGWLWLPVAISLFTLALLTAVRKFPHLYNLPAPRGSAQRPAFEALGTELLEWLQAGLGIVFLALTWIELEGAHERLSSGEFGSFLTVTFLATAAPIVWFFVRARSLSKPPTR